MNFYQYQFQAQQTAVYPTDTQLALAYVTLGLAGEAGEIANKVKKIIRDSDGQIDTSKRNEIADELGDVLWYVAMLATELGFNLGTIAEANVNKLKSRQDRGVLKGSGDNR